MRAVTWQGTKDIRVEHVPDPKVEEDTDVVIRVTSTGLCGSDLHLYEILAPFMEPGDIVGHEPMGVVEEVGQGVHHLDVGDRVVVPFNVSCGHCWMCEHRLQSQCETTQNHDFGTGAASPTNSRCGGMSDATTRTPEATASIGVRPKPSNRLGQTATDASR